jgi:hypothetical protein
MSCWHSWCVQTRGSSKRARPARSEFLIVDDEPRVLDGPREILASFQRARL